MKIVKAHAGTTFVVHLIRAVNTQARVTPNQCPAGRVFQYRVGSGRVLDKIPGIGSGSGRVGVSKYANGYFRVSLLVSGIFRYFGYFDPIPVSSSGYPFRGGSQVQVRLALFTTTGDFIKIVNRADFCNNGMFANSYSVDASGNGVEKASRS